MAKKLIFLLAFLLAVVSVHAASCPSISSTNTQDFLNEIPSIHAQLQGCPIQLPRGTGFLFGNPLLVEIHMNSGTLETISATVQNGQITGITRGGTACKKRLVTTEDVADKVLSSSSRGRAALFMIGTGGVRLQGCNWWTRFTGFFSRPIGTFAARKVSPSLPPPVQAGTGKPDNCDETYLPGHGGYAENKEVWDRYSSDTTNVCQSQYGRGTPSPCVHTVQLSVQGNPYYLCWYNA